MHIKHRPGSHPDAGIALEIAAESAARQGGAKRRGVLASGAENP